MKNYKIIYAFIIAALFNINPAYSDIIEKWQEVQASFELKKTTKENALAPHTVVARLIQLNGKAIEDVVDADGKTVEYFAVTYRVPKNVTGGKKMSSKTKKVTQYGLYRTIDTDLRAALSTHNTPLMMVVRYDVDNPTSFKFVINHTVYTTPLLVMDN